MEIGHDEEADNARDDAEELNAIEATSTVGDAVRDLVVKNNNSGAGGKDEYAQNKPTDREFPRHKLIIACLRE